MIEFRAIASSSAGNAFTISDGRSRLLLECGLGWKALRERLNFQVCELAGALITHEHGDHAKSAHALMAAGVDVYASRGTFDALELSGHRRHDVAALKPFKVCSWTVMPFPAVHDAAEPLGYLLGSTAGVGKVVFLTDTAYCPHRFRGLTHICVECNYSLDRLRERVELGELSVERKRRLLNNHFGLERLQEMLAANDLSQVQEIHLLHLSDENADEERFKREIMRQTGKPVFVAPR
jgi:phosphoribosyl 1,2-cyclic phosphodiesterase